MVCTLDGAKHRLPDDLHRWQFRIDLGPRTEPIIDGVRVSIGQAVDNSTVVASQQSEQRPSPQRCSCMSTAPVCAKRASTRRFGTTPSTGLPSAGSDAKTSDQVVTPTDLVFR